MDDVRIYNRALSATEVKELYNLGTVKITTPLMRVTSRAQSAAARNQPLSHRPTARSAPLSHSKIRYTSRIQNSCTRFPKSMH
jgi:hypothetical protein